MDVEMNGVCIFQYGNHPNWRGYNVQRYAGLLQEFWQEKIP
jgi:hypothetical protein